jgi:hypothetical protein
MCQNPAIREGVIDKAEVFLLTQETTESRDEVVLSRRKRYEAPIL